jgi:hypothetical protein
MAKIITWRAESVDTQDVPDIHLSDYGQAADSKRDWGMSLTEGIDFPEVTASDQPCEDSLTATGSFDLSGFWLSSFVKIMRAIPTPAMLVDRFCSVVFANASCAKPGADLGPIQGWSLLGILLGESDSLRVCEAISEVFDSGKPQVVETFLKATGETILARMHFKLVGLNEEKLALVLIENLTEEKELDVFSRRREETLLKAREMLGRVRHKLERRAGSL